MLLHFLVCIVWLVLMKNTSCTLARIPSRVCPLGLYCPDEYSCMDSSECVDSCYMIKPTHQGNGTTGRCEEVSTSSDVWLDSSLYEVLVYRQLEWNEILTNISLIAKFEFWNSVNIGDEVSPEDITFRLTSSPNHTNFTVNSLPIGFKGFQNRSVPEILKRGLIISSSSQSLILGDYSMKIQVMWQNMTLAESHVVIHVVDPLPTLLPVPETLIQFDSERYNVSSLDLSVRVTLVSFGIVQTEAFDVFVIAEDTLSADSEDFTPGWYRATFNPGITNVTTNDIPILSRALDNSVERFSLELYIPGASYRIGVQSGALKKAIINIKDVTEVFANIGKDINVPPFVNLTMSCDHLISTLVPFNITWTIERLVATNYSNFVNALISQDKRHLIIAPTLLTVGGQFGSRGTYACTVCFHNGTCVEEQSRCEICEIPRLNKAATPITKISTNSSAVVKCGENLCIGSSHPSNIYFTCSLKISEAADYEINVYKDDTFYNNEGSFSLSEIMIPHSLGMYETVLNDSCGMDIAISVLSLCDLMTVHFDSTVFTGSESSGNIIISMKLIRNTIMNGEISVIVIPSDLSMSLLSAEGNGVDYISTPITATFPAGVNSTTVDVPVIIDNVVEENETLQLEIFLPAPVKFAVQLGNPAKAIAIITDSSTSIVNFEKSTYSVLEASGPVQPVLVLSNPSSSDVTVQVMIFDQQASAIGGVDFLSGPYTVMFPAGVTRVPFNVTIIDDDILEHDETFTLTTDLFTLPNRVTIGSSSHAIITIINDDSLTVSFSHSTYTANENQGSLHPILILNNPSAYLVTVEVLSTDGSATGGGVDYASGPYNVSFPPGDTSASFDISITDQIEDNENFTLSISPHLPPLITHGDITEATVIIFNKNTDSNSSVPVGLIAGCSAGVIAAIVLIITIILFLKYKRKRKSLEFNQRNEMQNSADLQLVNPTYDGTKPTIATGFDEWRNQMKLYMINYSALKIEEIIAKGQFGVVHRGLYTRKNHEITEVAIKKLKDLSLSKAKEFIEECNIVRRFDHPNVLSLIGVSIIPEEDVPLMIMPYMHHGDVRSFLKSKRGNIFTAEKFPHGLNHNVLAKMCLDVAKGMEYLSVNHFVHRDLAARNCMLDHNMIVKVADFGLSRDIYVSDYYRLDCSKSTPLPVKWLAPEAIFDRIFTTKSDIWAFGVTCWEVFSLGLQPYPSIDAFEVANYVRNGKILDKPQLSSDDMYNIMKSCWSLTPEERPSFTSLVESIGQQLHQQVGRIPSYLPIH